MQSICVDRDQRETANPGQHITYAEINIQFKFFGRGSRYFRRLAANIKRKYGTGDGPVTLREFVQHIIDRRTRRPLDRHWRPVHELCQPCRVRYDFIGHYETLAADSRYVLARLGIHGDQLPQPSVVHNSTGHVTEMLDQLTDNEIGRLLEVYRLDFALFGYSANISHYRKDAA